MKQKKPVFSHSALFMTAVLSFPVTTFAGPLSSLCGVSDTAVSAQERIDLLEKAIEELTKQAKLQQDIIQEQRKSAESIQKSLENFQRANTVHEVWLHTLQGNHLNMSYNLLLNRIQNWRAYYQALNETLVQEYLDALAPGIEARLTEKLMHPSIRLDLACQFAGLMLVNQPSVANARESGLFDAVLTELAKEYNLRKQTSTEGQRYLFDTLAEQLDIYLKQMDVPNSVIKRLIRFS